MNKKLFILLISALLLATTFAQQEEKSDKAFKNLESAQKTINDLKLAATNAKNLQQANEVAKKTSDAKFQALEFVAAVKKADEDYKKFFQTQKNGLIYYQQQISEFQVALTMPDNKDDRQTLMDKIENAQKALDSLNLTIPTYYEISQKLTNASLKAQSISEDIVKASDEIQMIAQSKIAQYTAEEEAKKAQEEANKAQEEEAKKTQEEEAKKAQEEAKKAQEEAKKAQEEEAKKTQEEEAKKAQEEAKKTQEEEAKKAQEDKKAEEAKKAQEEAKKAQEDKKAEEAKKAQEETNKAQEEAKKAEEAKKTENKVTESKVNTNPSSGKVIQFVLAFTAILLGF
ncbi:hypothetical protein TTHERM_00644760 (macronuclear) [Tetrahymena thermophila SB210]|uniref:Transmembrane protein n=1 Tax=Tetrahymena thermophila (strain SB210) TaxID=312017 RepID=Q23EV5_TETTS|nr:hypothetical protein TTHERM_00644760 [Tetrahymena thermophila SB210]EAR95150.1 hypothetical protein TTHERM_00644760 [Tetrahymena thermophila SB210]|eukprot:XP_001015395.1 hypothetical protein TTHERM_00644760 [Tetrahymena thermophila SB210]